VVKKGLVIAVNFDDLLQQGKIKRIFRAKQKITTPGLISHITQRATGDTPLFLEDDDYIFMLSTLKDVSMKRALDVYAFCLMPNHVHFLLRPCNDMLDAAMRDLFSRYAMFFNRKYERKGHLFGGPYRQAICLDDPYLLAASIYIHQNPVKAGLEEDPKKYRWSSVRVYFDKDAPDSFVKPSFVLRLLSKDNSRQKEIYQRLLSTSVPMAGKDISGKKDVVSVVVKALARRFPSVFSRVRKEKRIASLTGLELVDDEALDKELRKLKRKKARTSPKDRKARRFLVNQLIARGYKRREIAEKLGVSVKTVYNILKTPI